MIFIGTIIIVEIFLFGVVIVEGMEEIKNEIKGLKYDIENKLDTLQKH